MADEAARKQAALAGARVPENVKQEIIAIAQEEFPRVSQLVIDHWWYPVDIYS